jgi:hypothetical protein
LAGTGFTLMGEAKYEGDTENIGLSIEREGHDVSLVVLPTALERSTRENSQRLTPPAMEQLRQELSKGPPQNQSYSPMVFIGVRPWEHRKGWGYYVAWVVFFLAAGITALNTNDSILVFIVGILSMTIAALLWKHRRVMLLSALAASCFWCCSDSFYGVSSSEPEWSDRQALSANPSVTLCGHGSR